MVSKSLESKIDEAMRLLFVGNYDEFSEEEINELYREAGSIFRRVSSQWGESVYSWEYKTIFVALVNLTKGWQSGEDGWLAYLSKKLFGTDDQIQGKAYGILTKCVEGLARRNDIFMLTSMRDKYYATICCHAFSPLSSTESLFDLCWEVYANDLDFTYPLQKSLLEEIGKSLKTKLEKALDNKDFTLGSKIYSLRIGMKGLAVDNQEALSQLLNEILQNIDCCFNSKAFPKHDYLSKLVSRWWKRKSSAFGTSVKRKYSSVPVRDLSSFRPRYIARDGIPYLLIPRIRFSGSISDPFSIKVMNGDETKIEEPIRTYGSGLLSTTEEVCFPLETISPKADSRISVSLYRGNQKVYDSNKGLFRNFILFDKSGKEARGESLIPGNFFLYIDDPYTGQIPQDIQRIKGSFFSLVTKDNDVLQVGAECVYFEHIQTDRKAYLLYDKVSNVSYECEGVEYIIINGDLTLVIASEVNLQDVGVKCGEDRFNLSDFPRKEQEGKIQFNLNSLADKGKPVSILVFCYSTNKMIVALSCLRFQDFKIHFDHDLYYSSSDKTPDLWIGQVEVSFAGQTQIDDLFDISQDEFSLPYRNGSILYTPPILRWRVDNGDYFAEPKSVYFKRLTNGSVLHVSFPLEADDIVTMNSGPLTKNSQGDFNLGAALYSTDINKHKEVIVFLKRKGEFYEILRVFMAPGFLFNPLFIDSERKSVIVDLASFIGPTDAKLELVLSSWEEKTIKRIPLTESLNVIDLNDISDGAYTLSVVHPRFIAFKKEDDVVFQKKAFLGDERKYRFKGKSIRLRKIMPIGRNQFSPIGIMCRISHISYLKTIDGFDIYSGELFKWYQQEKTWQKVVSLKDKKGNPIKVNPIRIEIMTNHTCYLGYGLDLEDPELDSYDEFSISYDGQRLLVGNGWPSILNIDYFYFDMEDEHV